MRVSRLVDSVRLMEFSIAFTFNCCSSDVCDPLSPGLALLLLLLLLLLSPSVRIDIVHDSSSSDNTVSIPSADLFWTKHNTMLAFTRHSPNTYLHTNIQSNSVKCFNVVFKLFVEFKSHWRTSGTLISCKYKHGKNKIQVTIMEEEICCTFFNKTVMQQFISDKGAWCKCRRLLISDAKIWN